MSCYVQGTEILLSVAFTAIQDGSGTQPRPADPSSVVFHIRREQDAPLELAAYKCTAVACGTWRAHYTPELAGTYSYYAVGEGAVKATSPTKQFTVKARPF